MFREYKMTEVPKNDGEYLKLAKDHKKILLLYMLPNNWPSFPL